LSAFTYCLLESIDELGADSITSDLLEAASQKLADNGFSQTPLLKEPINPDHLGARQFVTLEPRESDDAQDTQDTQDVCDESTGAGSEDVDKGLLSAIGRMLEDKLPEMIARTLRGR
jgi:hypothetical protein